MNVFLFLVAAYETTSTVLAYSTYILALNLHEQKKLQEEIDRLPLADINEMKQLDLFDQEVLRMYPIPISFVNRQCLNDTIVCDHHIAKGNVVFVFSSFSKSYSYILRRHYSARYLFDSL